MSSPRALTLGNFNGVARGSGDFRAVTGWQGWDDTAAVRLSIGNKAQQDGAWDATGFLGPRTVSLEGYVEQGTHTDALSVRDELASLTPRQALLLSIDQGDGGREAVVRVSQGAVFQWVNDVTFRYTVQVTAPDPLKYGAQTFGQAPFAAAAGGTGLVYPLAYPLDYGVAPGVTPGSVACANAGTASYWPTLRIDGPVRNPVVSLVETGDWIRYGGTIADGQHLDIDCANRRVTIGDTPVSVRSKVTSYGSWLAVPPGGGSVAVTADTAGANSALSVWSREGAWS